MAQYFTDFSNYPAGLNPAGWTMRWATTQAFYSIQHGTGSTGDSWLAFSNTDGGTLHHLFSWDEGEGPIWPADVEVVARFQTAAQPSGFDGGILVRGSGGQSSKNGILFAYEDGFFPSIYLFDNDQRIRRVDGSFPYFANEWLWLRFRVTGQQFQGKYWRGTAAQEPSTFQLSTTDARVPGSGWIGLYTNRTAGDRFWDLIGIGTDGDPAPTVPIAPHINLAGTIAPESNLQGDVLIAGEQQLDGTVEATSDLQTDLSVAKMHVLNGTVEAESLIGADLSVVVPGAHELEGELQAQSGLSGGLDVEIPQHHPLQGDVDGQSLLRAGLRVPVATEDRAIHARVAFLRNPEIDVSPWVTTAEINLGNVSSVGTGSSGGDGVVRQAFVTIQNDNLNRFSPLDATSSWNYDGMIFDPLIKPNREMLIYIADLPVGQVPVPGDYDLVFHGLVGDSIRTEGQVVEIECRDLAKRLQDRTILAHREYGAPLEDGGVLPHVVMQQILDDEFGIGVIPLYVPVAPPPDLALPPFAVEFGSVWDWLQDITAQIGWWLGYKYDSGTSSFRLTLLEPPRDKTAATADWDFDGDDVFVQDLDITDRDIRNRVAVVFKDESGLRQTVTVEDAASIAEFGLRPMQIDETDTTLIQTVDMATNLANYALEDLAGQRATNSLTLPLLHRLELYDGITVTDSRVSSEVEFYGVESIRHTLDFAGQRLETEAIASGRVIGSHQRWLQMQARAGSDGNPPGDVWPVRPNTILTVAADNTAEEGKRRADLICVGMDDQRTINRAINRLGVEGGQINLLEGDYNITESIILNDNVTLQGEGEGTRIKIADGLNYPSFFIMIHRDATALQEGENLRVYDLLLDGNFINNNVSGSMYGIIFDFTRDSWVQNVRFTGIREYPFACFSSRGIYFQDNIVIGCGDSIDFALSEKCNVTGNLIMDPIIWGGMRFYSDCVDFNVTGNQFFDVTDFSGCISLQFCEDFRISENEFKDVAVGFGLDQGVHRCNIMRNQVVRSQGQGVFITAGTGNNRSMDNIIAYNNFTDCGLLPAQTDSHITLSGGADRNVIHGNVFRNETGLADYSVALRGGAGTFPTSTLIDNNDFLDGYVVDPIDDQGINTDIGTGNRPFTAGPTPSGTFYTDFTDWPLGETPYDWRGWHHQDYYAQVCTVIEDGQTALYMNNSTSTLWRIWGPKDAPAARNMEIFSEFKITSTLTGNTNPMGIWMRVSGWNDSRLGGLFVTAVGTTFSLRARNFTGYTTLDSQAGLIAANTWYKVRFRAEGQDLFAKLWQSVDPEPVGWTLQATQSAGFHETGARIGLANGTTTSDTYYRQFGYAIAGDTAPGN